MLSSDHVGGGSRVQLQTLPTALTGGGDSTVPCLDDPMEVQGRGGSCTGDPELLFNAGHNTCI